MTVMNVDLNNEAESSTKEQRSLLLRDHLKNIDFIPYDTSTLLE